MQLRSASIILVLLSMFSGVALAAISSPDSHARYSRDGKRILVMISNNLAWDGTRKFVLQDGRVVIMRDAFPKSGCYDAQTLGPIWQVNWFAFEWELRTSDDFTQIVRLYPKAMSGGPALDFYTNGNLIRSYGCRDLLRNLNSTAFVNFTSGGWHYQWYDHERYNLSGINQVNLDTGRRIFWIFRRGYDLGYQEHYTFDLASGKILACTYSGIDTLVIVIAKLAAAAVGGLLMLAWLLRRIGRCIRACRIAAHHCRNCAYDLTGNASGVCPECGERIECSGSILAARPSVSFVACQQSSP
jgi:hypothetical protein